MNQQTLPEIREADRVASDTIRGYLAQTLVAAHEWLELGVDAVLMCEGNEDVDRIIRDPVSGKIREVQERQVKDLKDPISIRNVADTLRGFSVGFHRHTEAQRRCRFLFSTTAELAKQRTDDELLIDVLAEWPKGADTPKRGLISSLKSLLENEVREDNDEKAQMDRAALRFLNGPPTRWREFIASVQWEVRQPTVKEAYDALQAKVGNDKRLAHLPAELFAQRLITEVFRRTAEKEVEERVLSPALLDDLAKCTNDDLRAWVDEHETKRILELTATIDQMTAQLAELRIQTEPAAIRVRALAVSRERLLQRTVEAIADADSKQNFEQLGRVSITRDADAAIETAVQAARLVLVTGDAGAGKTSALASWARAGGDRRQLVWIEAAGIVGATRDALGLHLGLELAPDDVLSSFDGKERVLVIDGVDALREPRTREMILGVATALSTSVDGWRVVLSMRSHDARADAMVRTLKAPTVTIEHFSEEELARLAAASPSIGALLATASKPLRELLRLPFHVRLVAQLLDQQVALSDLQRIGDELELLDLYWKRRITNDAAKRDVREHTIQSVIARIASTQRLTVERNRLQVRDSLDELLSIRLLEHPHARGVVDDRRVLFSHDLLLDYSVYELQLRAQSVDDVIAWLAELGFFAVGLGTAVAFAVHEARKHGARRLADFVEAIEASALPEPLKQLVARGLLAIDSVDDLAALIEDARKNDGTTARAVLERLVKELIGVAHETQKSLLDLHHGPWAQLAEVLSRDLA